MTTNSSGVPASPSGCQPTASAAEEASSLSGIPNAGVSLKDAVFWWADHMMSLAVECDTKGAQTGRHHSIMVTTSAATNVAYILFAAASAIEAAAADETTKIGSTEGESAAPQEDAHD